MIKSVKIHERLKQYLIDNGIKQSYVATQTGIAPNTLNMILNGKVKLDSDRIYLIMKKININPMELFY